MRYAEALYKMAAMAKTADPNRTILDMQRNHRKLVGSWTPPGLTPKQYATVFPRAYMGSNDYIFVYPPWQGAYTKARQDNFRAAWDREENMRWPNRLSNALGSWAESQGDRLIGAIRKMVNRPVYADVPGAVRQRRTALGTEPTRKI